jgi:hypothetical protein
MQGGLKKTLVGPQFMLKLIGEGLCSAPFRVDWSVEF